MLEPMQQVGRVADINLAPLNYGDAGLDNSFYVRHKPPGFDEELGSLEH